MEEDQANIEGQQRKRLIPELSKLPWFIQVPLLLVAIFIIVLPYILMQQKNPFNQAVAAYDSLCKMKHDGDQKGISSMISSAWEGKKAGISQAVKALQCVHRGKEYKLFIKVDQEKHYILLLKGHGMVIRVRFAMEHDKMRWLPFPDNGKKGS